MAYFQVFAAGFPYICKKDDSIMGGKESKMMLLAVLVLTLWVLYFAICGAPLGSEFIYADF